MTYQIFHKHINEYTGNQRNQQQFKNLFNMHPFIITYFP